MEEFGRYLSSNEADQLRGVYNRCMLAYCKLSSLAIENGQVLWPSRPKFHVSWHCSVYLAYIYIYNNNIIIYIYNIFHDAVIVPLA